MAGINGNLNFGGQVNGPKPSMAQQGVKKGEDGELEPKPTLEKYVVIERDKYGNTINTHEEGPACSMDDFYIVREADGRERRYYPSSGIVEEYDPKTGKTKTREMNS